MSRRADILADVVTSLEAIAGSTVERRLLAPDEIAVDATPWFGLVPMGVESVRYLPGRVIEKTLAIVVGGAVAIGPSEDQSEEARAEVIGDLLDDIQGALSGTVAASTRNALAISTTITEQWTDEGEETAVVLESGHVIAFAIVRANILYQEERA